MHRVAREMRVDARWPWTPRTVTCAPSVPAARPFLIASPRRSTEVGSPTMQQSGRSPRGAASSGRRPWPYRRPPGPFLVAGDQRHRDRSRSGCAADEALGRDRPSPRRAPFMSAAPRPAAADRRGACGTKRPLARCRQCGPGGTTIGVVAAKASSHGRLPRREPRRNRPQVGHAMRVRPARRLQRLASRSPSRARQLVPATAAMAARRRPASLPSGGRSALSGRRSESLVALAVIGGKAAAGCPRAARSPWRAAVEVSHVRPSR